MERVIPSPKGILQKAVELFVSLIPLSLDILVVKDISLSASYMSISFVHDAKRAKAKIDKNV